MKSSIIKIGTSKGIVLPQHVLNECFIEDKVIIEVKGKHIIISAPGKPQRRDWEQAFKEMAANGDDQLLIQDIFENEEIRD
ncbi:MAG TPA: AbrB/MazE/SpoVT family DNA-binding domain-containing protein [Mucilaginibacter sp.]|jgi:antitoxin MazE